MIELWSDLSETALAGYAKHGTGERKSWGSNCDSDAKEEDPIVRNYRSTPLPGEKLPDKWKFLVGWGIDQFLSLAKTTTSRDKVVIFGRDCYFAVGMRVIAHKLRGQWFYAEGVSRNVMHEWSIKSRLKRMTIGVDTGFAGSIPRNVTPEAQCRLLSSDYEKFSIGAFSNHNNVREAAIGVEHLPKPFMRAVRVVNGTPEMALASKKEIAQAAAILRYAEDYCLSVINTWRCMSKEEWDLASYERLETEYGEGQSML